MFARLLDRILDDPLFRVATSSEGEANGLDAKTSAPLPLLEFALERLWLKAVQHGSYEFRHEDFDAMGGLAIAALVLAAARRRR